MNCLKVGAVSYLNTKPLVYGLESRPELDLIYDLPSRLADRLASNELDVGLIPVIEAINNPTYSVVSDACIACWGPVKSVKLFSRCSLDRVRLLALDEGSRTSAALCKIILAEKFGVRPDSVVLPMEDDWRQSNADAVLVIGDRAMDTVGDSFTESVDLGRFWNEWTGLPFVFAVWAAHRESDLSLLDEALCRARDMGLDNIPQICESAVDDYGLSFAECQAYLENHLHFQMGETEKQGLDLFFRYSKEYSLIDKKLELTFYDCKVTG